MEWDETASEWKWSGGRLRRDGYKTRAATGRTWGKNGEDCDGIGKTEGHGYAQLGRGFPRPGREKGTGEGLR